MLRRFKFEDEVYSSLSCVPMAVRRKLDKVGLKISLAQWQKLSRGERLAVCHLPIDSPDEREVIKLFLDEAVRDRSGDVPKPLSDDARSAADPPSEPPPELMTRAAQLGISLGPTQWQRLDDDERYALIKLGVGAEPSHNFGAALHEFLDSGK
jgi:hypothetical protein